MLLLVESSASGNGTALLGLSDRHSQAMESEESRISKTSHKLLIAPFRSTSKTSKLLRVIMFSTQVTCRESITIEHYQSQTDSMYM